jgi:hypothetical protein
MKYSAKDFKLDSEFYYSAIYNFCDENPDFTLTEHGENIIGESFLVLKDDDGSVISFVSTGYGTNGTIYKVVYTDF